MSNVTERLRKLDEQLTKDTLRIKKLEKIVDKTQGPLLVLVKALVVSGFTALFLAVSTISLTDNVLAVIVAGFGYIGLEVAERLFNMIYARR